EVAGNEVRLEVMSRHSAEPGRRDLHCLDAEGEELRMLRANTEVAPFLLWRQNKDGDVIWANRSYLAAATEIFGLQRVSMWPIPSLFRSTAVLKSGARNRVVRIQSVANVSDHKDWFDCHITEVDGDALCTAFPADEAVRSEARRQEFTQTLTKTFSDLSIGLAIFDRSRRLALFNPAVCDLTSLPVDFLTSRPSLVGFLDQLREKRVMPEPRDYRAWRNSIADLETAAMNGTYAETWSLPDGQTYRVSGRPHPDGAMALLFEDISAEMSLTRRFRAQLQQSQSIIDSLDEAVAVFSASGELTFSNAAYQALWSDPEEPSITGKTVVEATRLWHKLTVPTPIWGDFRDFAFQDRERDEWTGQVTMRDGRSVACRFVPHKAGSSLAIFHPQEAAGKVPSELRHAV
ncbi:MAG: diguanylate cyclase, partial [Silicimonas sp.]|nr:diguanylate cyclase [Silicimonas sp.]